MHGQYRRRHHLRRIPPCKLLRLLRAGVSFHRRRRFQSKAIALFTKAPSPRQSRFDASDPPRPLHPPPSNFIRSPPPCEMRLLCYYERARLNECFNVGGRGRGSGSAATEDAENDGRGEDGRERERRCPRQLLLHRQLTRQPRRRGRTEAGRGSHPPCSAWMPPRPSADEARARMPTGPP